MTLAPDSGTAPGLRRHRPSVRDALSLINAHRREWSSAGPASLVAPLLPGGTSNQSFLVRAGNDLLVLRLDGVDPGRNAIDRGTEFRLQAAAAAAGLAPRPRFCDPVAGVLLVDYLPPDAEPEAGSAADVGGLLRAVHRLRTDAPRLFLGARTKHYTALVQSFCDDAARNCLASLSDPLARACRALDTDTAAAVVCHNDLTLANRLYHNGRLYALDWEYAACGSRWFDLAVATDKHLDAVELLEAYLQRPPNAPERAQVARARLIARYLELLWLACNTGIEAREVVSGLRELTAWADTLKAIDRAP